MSRASNIVVEGTVERRHEADALLREPGSAVFVHRGVLRSLVLKCPDDCGEVLTINLDKRAGRAWGIYQRSSTVSLYPSVWRDTGCKSHFIVWRSKIYWCDFEPLDNVSDRELDRRVQAALTDEFVPFAVIAETLDEIPWAVLGACERLVALKDAERGGSKQRDHFRKKAMRGLRSFLKSTLG